MLLYVDLLLSFLVFTFQLYGVDTIHLHLTIVGFVPLVTQ